MSCVHRCKLGIQPSTPESRWYDVYADHLFGGASITQLETGLQVESGLQVEIGLQVYGRPVAGYVLDAVPRTCLYPLD